MLARIKQCNHCQAGVDGVTCMADVDPEGLCPIADRAPRLWSCNEVPLAVFSEAQNSARQISAEDKTYLYVRPNDVATLMDLYNVPQDERQEVMTRVRMLEDISNRVRPSRRKRPVRSRRRR